MTQDDSHTYVTPEQAPAEIKHLLDFVLGLLRDFGLDDFYLELSTRDEGSDKFIGTDEEWEEATERPARGRDRVRPRARARPGRRRVLRPEDLGAGPRRDRPHLADVDDPVRLQPAGAASAWSTRPSDGSRQQPVMIHSAKFGSIERFFGVLVEHYAGAFPAWLSPVQVLGIPVAEEFDDYLEDVAGAAAGRRASGSRSTTSDDRFPKKIRNASKAKVPFVLIAGEDDRSAGAVSFRYRDGDAEERRAGRRGDRRGRRRRADPGPGLSAGEGTGDEERGRDEDSRLRVSPAAGPGVRGGRGRVRAALDPAPDGLHPRGPAQPTDAGDGCPFCAAPAEGRRRGADRPPRRALLRRDEPLPVQPRARAGLPLPARLALRRPHRRGDGRVHGADQGRRSGRWRRPRRRSASTSA